MKKTYITKVKELRGSLPVIVRDTIEELILKGNLAPGSKLPMESDLAKELGISRHTLREALLLLEEDGLILRQHGRGTFVKNEPLVGRTPLEKNLGITEILKSMNLVPGTAEIKIKSTKSDLSISKSLQIEKNSSITWVERVRTANGKRVVYSVTFLPEHVLGKEQLPQEFSGSLYEFLENSGWIIKYGFARVIPTVAGKYLAKKLDIKGGSPLLLLEQVNYTDKNQAIMVTREYWTKDFSELTLFRKRR